MRIRVLTLDDEGGRLAERLAALLPRFLGAGCVVVESRARRDGPLASLYEAAFTEADGLVCVMASGIAVRMVAPLAESKLSDPAVVVLDDAARWAISLLSGHEGGANRLAYAVAAATGAEPVVTTGSETRRRHTLGIGCRRGTSAQSVRLAVERALTVASLTLADIRLAASARLKEDEPGLIEACRELELPLLFIPEARINSYDGPYERGGVAERRLGLRAVAEPCALLSSRNGRLVLSKTALGGVTAAIAMEEA